jgi:PAS domain S-box-containing protein
VGNTNSLQLWSESMKDFNIEPLIPKWLQHSEMCFLTVTDLEGNYIFVNDFFQKRFSYLEINLIGKHFGVTVHPDEIEKFKKVSLKCIQNPNKSFTLKIRKPDKCQERFFWSKWEFSLLMDLKGTPIGILCMGIDISEAEAVGRQAKEFAQKVETIIEEIPDGFCQLDKQLNVIKVNKVAEQLLGKMRDQLLGEYIGNVLPLTKGGYDVACLQASLDENRAFTFEFHHPEIAQCISAMCYPSKEGLTIFFKDITEEKANQLRLKDSEVKLRAILNCTQDSTLLISPDYKVLLFNKKAEEYTKMVFGQQLKINDNILDLNTPEYRPIFIEESQRALQGESIKREFEVNGFWFELSYNPVYDDDGVLMGFSLNSNYIDERIQYEERRQALLSSIPDLLFVIDKEGVFLEYQAKDNDLYISPEVFMQRKIQEVLPKDVAEPLFETIQRTLQNRETTEIEYELEIGEDKRFFQARISPFGKDKVIALSRDLTSIKEKEIKLAESEHRLQKTIEAIPHPLVIVSEEVEIQYVNDEFERVFGFVEKEVLGKKIDFLIPRRFRDSHNILEQNYLQKKRGAIINGRFLSALTKDGKEIIIDTSLNRFTANGKKFVIVILQDVSELKKRQDIILQQNENLKAIAWLQSHEVRRPVANILGICYLLRSFKDLEESIKDELLNHLQTASTELDEVITQIVQLSSSITQE